MNAPLPIAPSAPPAAASQAGPASQDAAADVPFSRVLSGEMAQRQAGTTDSGEPADPVRGKSAKGTTDEPTARQALDAATADSQTGLPDAMLALAQSPDLMKPAPAIPDTPTNDATASTPADLPLQFVIPAGSPNPAGIETPPDTSRPAGSVRPDMPSAGARLVAQAQAAQRDAGEQPQATAQTAQSLRTAEASPPVVERLPDFMTAMASAQTTQITAAAAAPLQASERLSPAVGSSAWSQALGDRVVWMATGGQQSASLTLNPPDLGPMQVVVNVSNDQATASFFAAQPEVRQALEAALPRLREMMQDAGIQLGQATVSADTPHQQDMQDRGAQQRTTPFTGGDGNTTAEQTAVLTQPVRTGRGLVDTFA